jgi:hypothetical protein
VRGEDAGIRALNLTASRCRNSLQGVVPIYGNETRELEVGLPFEFVETGRTRTAQLRLWSIKIKCVKYLLIYMLADIEVCVVCDRELHAQVWAIWYLHHSVSDMTA